MDLHSAVENDTNIITVNAKRIDAGVAIQFKDAMRASAVDGPARVILDMSQVAFVDSSGLGAIVASMKQLGGGHKIELAALTPDVDKVFRLTRMDSIFVIHTDMEQATSTRRAG